MRLHRQTLRLAAAIFFVFALPAANGCGGAAETAAPGDPAAPAAAPRAPASGGAEGSGARIVFLGDSLSAGFGLAESQAFPALIERALRDAGRSVDVLNAGVSGDTSAGGLSRLDWVLRGQPDVLVVELGGNDALRGQPLENTEANLRTIVERAREAGARVLLLGMDVPTNYGADYAGGFAALYPRIAAELDVAIVPGFIREVGLTPGLMQPDGIHPTAEGHRLLAASLVAPLAALLDEATAAPPANLQANPG